MKLATTTTDFFSYTGSQTVSLCHIREAGFRYADYSFCCDHSSRSGIYGANFEDHIAAVRETASRIGIRLVQAHAPMGKPLDDPDGKFLADTLLAVEACGRWGIPHLVVHSGYLPGLSKEETLERNKVFFLSLLRAAEPYGIHILVENFNKMYKPDTYWIDNAPDLLQMVELVDHPLFQAVWDTGHANLQEMSQDEALRLLGGHVRALHVQDNMGDKDTHLLPFLGTMNPDAVMHGLLDIGYKGYFTFEIGGIFTPFAVRRPFKGDARLAAPPLALRDAAERYLYDLGKIVLESYGCFEE